MLAGLMGGMMPGGMGGEAGAGAGSAPGGMPDLSGLMAALGGAGGGGMGGMGGMAGLPGLGALGGMGGFGAPPPVADPEAAYASQLQQLEAMGFYDRETNIRALQATGGNVNAAVDRLLSS